MFWLFDLSLAPCLTLFLTGMRAELLTHAVTSRTRAILVAHLPLYQHAVLDQYGAVDQYASVDQYGTVEQACLTSTGDQACGQSC